MKTGIIISALVCLCLGQTIPTDGLVFHYAFNGADVGYNSVRYLSPNGYNLRSSGSIQLTADQSLNPQSALQMNGTYYLSALLPDTTVHHMTDANDFTFGLMFNTTAVTGSMDARMDIAGLGDAYNSGITLSLNDNRIRIFLGNHGYYDSPAILNDGKWHSAVAVRSAGTVVLYIDGKESDQGAVVGTVYPCSDSLVIGRHGIKNESYYNGTLDEVFYYTKAFSADDIALLVEAMSGVKVSFSSQIDSFTVSRPPIAWHPVTNAIAYAFEIGTDSLFVNPFLSVPLEDTAYTVAQPLSVGRYYMRVGCNFDDRSPFFFSPYRILIIAQ